MKKLLLCAAAVVLAVSPGSSWAEPREASEIIKEYSQVKMPTIDATKIRDQAWVRSYLEERSKALAKQGELALELYQAHPEHPQALKLMLNRWTNMTSGRDATTSLAEMDQFLRDHPDTPERVEILYRRAVALSGTGLGDTHRMSDAIEEFIKAKPNDERGAALLTREAMRGRDHEANLKIYRRIVADYPGSRSAKMAAGHIRQADEVGKPFELSFDEALTGNAISVKSLAGKVVVVDFWATWCGPCVAEMPKMKELYAKYKPQGVEFIGVSLDQPGDGLAKLKAYVEENSIGWPQYYMGKGWESEFSQGWGINAIPCVFILDASGNLYSTEARGKLDTLIPELIKKRDEKS